MKHNYWKRTLAGVMALALTAGAVPTIPGGGLFKGTGTGITAYADDPISYLDASGITQSCTDYTLVTSSNDSVSWYGGWYVVKDNVTITSDMNAIMCNGAVNLILCDGASLTVSSNEQGEPSIMGFGDSQITIYAQSTGSNMGVLTINNALSMGNININGGSMNANASIYAEGNININGGSVTADGQWGGITAGGNITISEYGGSINANVPIRASGNINIGGGSVSVTVNNDPENAIYADGNITISGGTVEATGGYNSALCSWGTINVNGGTVTATATDEWSCGIIANSDDGITISGGNLTASGNFGGIGYTTVKNSIPGTGWTDTAGTTGMTPIAVNTTGQDVGSYKKVQFPPAVSVTGVSLNKESTTLTIGDEETLTATVAPDDATDKTVTWASDNTDVATVDANGKVTAVGAGTANITATATNGTATTDDDKTATCAVTVAEQAVVSGGFVAITSTDQITIDNIGEATSMAAVKNWLLENYAAIKASNPDQFDFDFCFKNGGNLYWYCIGFWSLNEENIKAIDPNNFDATIESMIEESQIVNLQDVDAVGEVLAIVSEYLGYGDVVYFWEGTAPAIDIADATLTFDKASFNYTGEAITPVLTVKYGEETLTEGVDYEIAEGSVTSATAAGDYTVTVNGIGNYEGTATAIWQIVAPAEYSITVENGTIRDTGETSGIFEEATPVVIVGDSKKGYWTDENGNIVSYNRKYKIYAMYDTMLTWNDNETQEAAAVANINLSERTYNATTKKTTVKVTSEWSLPAGATIIEAGTLRTASTDTITAEQLTDASYFKKSTLTTTRGTFYFNINLSEATKNKTIYAMTYVKYSYNGETKTLYSNMLTSAPTT